ncbi:MAG: polysaccharide biosynthesis tyrosine autokinase [Polyangia bacterium]
MPAERRPLSDESPTPSPSFEPDEDAALERQAAPYAGRVATPVASLGPEAAPARPKARALRSVRDDGQTELQRYLAVLLERKWVLLGMLVLLEALTALWLKAQPSLYETRASILVHASVPQALGSAVHELLDPTPANFYMMQDYLQTSRKVLTSDSLARRAAARLGLVEHPDFFSPAGAGGASGDGGRPAPKLTLDEAAEALLSHYSADVVAETRVLLVTARHTSPEWAKKIADAVADEFVADAETSREVNTQVTSKQLADELDRLRKAVQEADLALYEYKAQHDMLSVSLEDRANQVSRQIDKYTDALTEIRLRKLQRQSQLTEIKKLKEVDALHVPVMSGEMPPLLGELRRTYAEESRRLAELRTRYQDSHPQVQQQSVKVEQILRELGREVEVALSAASLRYNEAASDEQKVSTELATLKQEGLRISRLEIEYNKLKRESDSVQKQYAMVLNRTKETGMVGRMRQRHIQVLDYARLPKLAVSPRPRVTLLLVGMLALLLGVGLAFALDALDRTLKSQEDVEAFLGLPLLGMVPRFQPGSRRHPPDLYVAYHPRSTVAEACRAVRTNLLFAGAERELRTILLTSSMAREGKTLCCVSLGTVLAKSGARTLIIDGDLRRPRIARAFGMGADSSALGLTSVLVGEAKLDEVIRATPVEGLDVLPSGPTPPNPAELLNGQHFRAVLDELGRRYDRVLIDSPPAVPVTDPAILATRVDGVVLVVRHAQTHRDAARRAAQHILDVGGNIVGVVLNEIDIRAKGYRAYYGLYSDYKSEYHDPAPDPEAAEPAPSSPRRSKRA